MARALVKHINEAVLRSNPITDPKGNASFSKFIGDDEVGPWIYVNRLSPNFLIPEHSHTENEIMVVLEGQMSFDGRRCPPGTVIYVEQDTSYSLLAGQQGVLFLNIREGSADFQIERRAVDARDAVGESN